jgi:hypothetical protein
MEETLAAAAPAAAPEQPAPETLEEVMSRHRLASAFLVLVDLAHNNRPVRWLVPAGHVPLLLI